MTKLDYGFYAPEGTDVPERLRRIFGKPTFIKTKGPQGSAPALEPEDETFQNYVAGLQKSLEVAERPNPWKPAEPAVSSRPPRNKTQHYQDFERAKQWREKILSRTDEDRIALAEQLERTIPSLPGAERAPDRVRRMIRERDENRTTDV